MKIHKINLFVYGVLLFLFLLIISPVFCTAAVYSVRWDIELENSPRGFSVDVDDNLHFSYWNSDGTKYYFSKISKEGLEFFDKALIPQPSFNTYLIDDFGKYFFVSIEKKINTWSGYLGKEFTISHYSADLIYISTFNVNLSSCFEGEFLGNLKYVDSDCIYFAILEYQGEYDELSTELDCIQLAKFSTTGEKLWNRTIALNPDSAIFSFCKNSYGNVYVENEGVLYYIDDENGTDIWQQTIVIDDPTISLISLESKYLMAFKENALLVVITSGLKLFMKLCKVDGNFDWELKLETETNNQVFNGRSIVIEDDFLGITTLEEDLVYDEGEKTNEKTNIFHFHLLNSAKEVLYEERIEITDEVVASSDILRGIIILPTSEGHFYRYEFMRDRENDIIKNTIQYCIPKTNFIPGYTFIISLSSISILVLLVINRRKISK